MKVKIAIGVCYAISAIGIAIVASAFTAKVVLGI